MKARIGFAALAVAMGSTGIALAATQAATPQPTNGTGVPAAIEGFFNKPAEQITLKDIRTLLNTSDSYFATADGTGEYTAGASWVTLNKTTLRDWGTSAREKELFTPKGKYVEVLAPGSRKAAIPREMYAIPRTTPVKWALTKPGAATCDTCPDFAQDFPYISEPAPGAPTVTRTENANGVTVTVKYAKKTTPTMPYPAVTVVLTGDLDKRTFTYTMRVGDWASSATANMTSPGLADVPQIVKDGGPNPAETATYEQYLAAGLIDTAKDLYFMPAVTNWAVETGDPTAAQIRKVVGKKLTVGEYTYVIGQQTGRAWKVTATSTQYKGVTAQFWYTPAKKKAKATYIAVGY